MSARFLSTKTGIQSYDCARWTDWVPQRSNLVVRPQLGCLFQRVPPGACTNSETIVPPNDTHHMLLFWTAGTPNLTFQLDRGKRRIAMRAWEGLHIPPGQSSWWEASPQSTNGVFHVHLSREMLDQTSSETPPIGDAIGNRAVDQHLSHLARLLLRDTQLHIDAPSLLWDSYAVLLARALATCGVAAPIAVRGGLAPWQARRCIEYLNEHASDNIGLDTLAGLVNLSPYHFARAFRQTVGVPPHRYQLNLRIAKAKILLETTQAPVTHIAFDVGYESSQALARLFRREVGVSPSDYRRQCDR